MLPKVISVSNKSILIFSMLKLHRGPNESVENFFSPNFLKQIIRENCI